MSRSPYPDCGKCPYLGECTNCEHPELRDALAEIKSLRAALSTRAGERERVIEEVLALIPGGNICDPQEIADTIRALKASPTTVGGGEK